MKRAMVILRKELKDTVRDRRTLMVMVLVPIVVMPLILIASVKLSEWSSRSQAEDVVQLMVAGDVNAPLLVRKLAVDDRIEVIGVSGDPEEGLDQGTIDAFLEIPDDFMKKLNNEESVDLKLLVDSTSADSAAAVDKVRVVIEEYNDGVIAERLESQNLTTEVLNGVVVDPVDTATGKKKGGTFLGYLLPMFLVIFAMIGGMYTAMDISAGEKERRTLEALLMTPASRGEIVTGKFLAVATVSIVTVLLSVAAMFITAPMISGSIEEIDVTLDLNVALVMLPAAILLAAMFSALLLAVSIFARGYKEAQNYVTPLYLLAVLPVIVANALPASDNPLLFLVPGFNAVLLFREVLVGDFIVDHIALTMVSSIFYTLLSIRYAAWIFSREDVLLDEGGNPRRDGNGWSRRKRLFMEKTR